MERSTVPAPARLRARLHANTAAVLLVAGLVLAGVALAGFGATRHYRTESAAPPQTSQAPSAGPPQRPKPRTYPTQGEMVPPAPATPKPTVTPIPTPQVSRSSSRPSNPRRDRRCPGDWRRFPPLKEWCEKNGYRTD